MSASNGNGQHKGKGSNPASLKAIEPHRFPKGYKGGNGGNPLAARCNELRASLVNAASREDVKAIALKLIEDAKAGNIGAVHELFNRLFGKAPQSVDMNVNAKVSYANEVHDDMRRVLDSPAAAEALRALNDRVRSN